MCVLPTYSITRAAGCTCRTPADVMQRVGGFRYVVNHSIDPDNEPYAGMAELYFPDASGWSRYVEASQSDGIEAMVDVLAMTAGTEMIGIP